jgi:hypothetical protein
VYSIGNTVGPLGFGSGGAELFFGGGNDGGGFGGPGQDCLVPTSIGSLASSAQMGFVAATASQADATLFAAVNPTLTAADQVLGQAVATAGHYDLGGSLDLPVAAGCGGEGWPAPPTVGGFCGGSPLQHGQEVHPAPVACGSHFG